MPSSTPPYIWLQYRRMCMMDFSREQIEEITKSLDAHMKLSILLSYLYPTTSAEEMAKKRNEHLSKRD